MLIHQHFCRVKMGLDANWNEERKQTQTTFQGHLVTVKDDGGCWNVTVEDELGVKLFASGSAAYRTAAVCMAAGAAAGL